ncbi:MAG: hypothetical protein ABIP42_02050 [Planctomycetota bacterium]
MNDTSKSSDQGAQAARQHGGLCPRCQNVKIITSAKSSTFLLCQLSSSDARFPKYPPQPVARCSGFAERRL